MRWYQRLFRRARTERQLDAELRFHLEQQIADYVAAGLTPEEARRRTRLEFGGLDQVKEECRDVGAARFIETLIQDLRYGLRQLRRNPGFTAVAVITLALGIGANTSIFSVIDGVLLAPLPYWHSGRLVMMLQSNPFTKSLWSLSYPDFLDWQRGARLFQHVEGFLSHGFNLTSPGVPAHVDGMEISAAFFSTLGIKPIRGRYFTREEDRPGGAPAVIISHRLFTNRFGGRPEALGSVLALDGVDYTVIGVLPATFHFGGQTDVYTPLGQGDRATLSERSVHPGIAAIGRLKPGVSLAQAQAEMSAIQKRLDCLYPHADRDEGASVRTLKQAIIGNISGTLLMLFGAVGLVLLIACVNVANLLLARSATRTREFAVRSALGASRARMVRQLVAENVLLSIAGGATGLLIAAWGVKPVLAAVPGTLPRSGEIHLNLAVLVFAFGIAALVGIIFEMAPALRGFTSDLQGALKEGGRSSSGSQSHAQNGLVILQMAVTLVLLVGAGLLFRTIQHMWETNPGFDARGLVSFKVGLSGSLTKTASSTRANYRQLVERIRDIPGVEAADITTAVPLTGGGLVPFWPDSQKPRSIVNAPRTVLFETGPDYLHLTGIPLVRGRFLTADDTAQSPPVVVIDTILARAYFAGQDPVGKTITIGHLEHLGPMRIVGVVGHVRQWGLGKLTPYTRNQVYAAFYQAPAQWMPIMEESATIMVRTSLAPSALMRAIRKVVYGSGSLQTVYDIRTMHEIIAESLSPERFPMILLGIFAGLALVLASVGIYGVISYAVTHRVHEIGIRMALGAQRREVFRMVVGEGLRLALAGIATGAVAALILTRVLSSFSHLIYGVGPADPVTFVCVSVVMITSSFLACYIPARRATKVDPMVALRHE
jgi:predicted permease